MKKYKLTRQNMTTHGWYHWVLGEWREIPLDGNMMCSNQVFHFYDSPARAVFFNPIHADIFKPRLFEIEIDKVVAHDGAKGGCKRMRLVKEIPLLPHAPLERTIEIAIRSAFFMNENVTEAKGAIDPVFKSWAETWLDGDILNTHTAGVMVEYIEGQLELLQEYCHSTAAGSGKVLHAVRKKNGLTVMRLPLQKRAYGSMLSSCMSIAWAALAYAIHAAASPKEVVINGRSGREAFVSGGGTGEVTVRAAYAVENLLSITPLSQRAMKLLIDNRYIS